MLYIPIAGFECFNVSVSIQLKLIASTSGVPGPAEFKFLAFRYVTGCGCDYYIDIKNEI